MADMTKTPTVTATNPRLSEHRVRRGIDVDIRVELGDGKVIVGGVTLVPDDAEVYSSWGAPDNWLSDSLLDLVKPWPESVEILGEIAAHAREQITEHWSDLGDELDRAAEDEDEDDDQCEF